MHKSFIEYDENIYKEFLEFLKYILSIPHAHNSPKTKIKKFFIIKKIIRGKKFLNKQYGILRNIFLNIY